MSPNFSSIVSILETAVNAGHEVCLKYYKTDQDLEISTKEHRTDLVTKADIETQRIIQETITRLMLEAGYVDEEIGFFGEEESLFKTGRVTFLIDPIDGTKNFTSGLDIFGISVAAFDRGAPVAGVIAAPAFDRIYLAETGKGAWLKENGSLKKLQTQPCTLGNGVINFDINSNFPDMKGIRESMISELSPLVRTIRMLGSSTIETCWTAENIINFAVFARQKAWDIAAGKIILEESGGSMVDWRGMEFDIDPTDPNKRYFAVAAERSSVRQILPYLDIASLNNMFG